MQSGDVAAAARDNQAVKEEHKKINVHDIQAVPLTRTSVSITDAKVTPSEAKQASPGSLSKHAAIVPHCASEGRRGRKGQ